MRNSRVVRWGSNRGLSQSTQVEETTRDSQRGDVTQEGDLNNEKENRKREGNGERFKGRVGFEGVV